MATRISLIRAARQTEERDQIGNLVSPFAQSMRDIEKRCLLRLSEAARAAGQVQIALNAVVRSQRLEASATFDVSQEFASVLWLQREQKLAVQYLKELLHSDSGVAPRIDTTRKALLLAQLVCILECATSLPPEMTLTRGLGHQRHV
jgi:ataxia telangiectasia mutated family protein